MTIVKPPPELSEGFWLAARHRERPVPFIAGAPACWLAPFDPLKRLCKGKWEAFHFIGKQEIRNLPAFAGILTPEDLMPMEWDPRNAGIGCVEHHRPFDSFTGGPRLVVPRAALQEDTEEFIFDYMLESIAERRFSSA